MKLFQKNSKGVPNQVAARNRAKVSNAPATKRPPRAAFGGPSVVPGMEGGPARHEVAFSANVEGFFAQPQTAKALKESVRPMNIQIGKDKVKVQQMGDVDLLQLAKWTIFDGNDIPAYPQPAANLGTYLESCLWKFKTKQYYRSSRREIMAFFAAVGCSTAGKISVADLQSRIWLFFDDDTISEELQSLLEQADTSGEGLVDADEFHQACRLGVSADAVKKILRGAERPSKNSFWVPRSAFINYLHATVETANNCRSLPFVLLIFSMVFLMVALHLQTEKGFLLMGALRQGLEEGLDGAVGEWNEEIEGNWYTGYYGSIDIPSANLGHSNAYIRGRFKDFYQLIGAHQLRVVRTEEIDCKAVDLNAAYAAAVPAPNVDTKCLSDDHLNPLHPERDGLFGTTFSGTEVLYLAGEVHENILHNYLQNTVVPARWIHNRKTLSVIITSFYYNAQSHIYLYMQKKIYRDDVSTPLKTKLILKVVPCYPYRDAGFITMVVDLIYVCLISWTVINEIGDFFHKFKVQFHNVGTFTDTYFHAFKFALYQYATPWNVIDWFNIFFSANIITIYYSVNTQTWTLNDTALDYRSYTDEQAGNLDVNSEEYSTRISNLHKVMADLVNSYEQMKAVLSIYCISATLVFFKGFRANPKMNVVLQTAQESWAGLLHFFMVFCVVLMVFVLMAHVIYGKYVADFQDVGSALRALFMHTIGLEVDNVRDDMYDTDSNIGTLFQAAFLLFMALILLNMILAIIFDTYADVKAATGDTNTIFDQIQEIWEEEAKRIRKLRDRAQFGAGANAADMLHMDLGYLKRFGRGKLAVQSAQMKRAQGDPKEKKSARRIRHLPGGKFEILNPETGLTKQQQEAKDKEAGTDRLVPDGGVVEKETANAATEEAILVQAAEKGKQKKSPFKNRLSGLTAPKDRATHRLIKPSDSLNKPFAGEEIMSARSASSYTASSSSGNNSEDDDSQASDSAPSNKVSEDTFLVRGQSGESSANLSAEIDMQGQGPKAKKKHGMQEISLMAAKIDVSPDGEAGGLSAGEVDDIWARTVPKHWVRSDSFVGSDLNFAMLANDSEVEGDFASVRDDEKESKETVEEEEDDFGAVWTAEHLYKHLTEANAHSSRTCTTESMLENFEGMESHEAEHLLEMADEWHRAEKIRREIGFEDMLRLTSRVDSNIREGIRKFTLMPKVAGADPNTAEDVADTHVLPFRDDLDRMIAKMCYLKGMAGLGTSMMDSRIHNKEDPRYQEWAAKQPKWRKGGY